MKIFELIAVGNVLKDTKVGTLNNTSLRKYIRFITEYNKVNAELEEKRRNLALEAMKQKGYTAETLTPAEEQDIIAIISPMIDEFVMQESNAEEKFLTWDELYDAVLNNDNNKDLTANTKSLITSFLCSEEL